MTRPAVIALLALLLPAAASAATCAPMEHIAYRTAADYQAHEASVKACLADALVGRTTPANALGYVKTWLEGTDAVHVEVRDAFLQPALEKARAKDRDTLWLAYLAGVALPSLGTARPTPVEREMSGVRALIDTHERLRKEHPRLRNAAIESYMLLLESGELEAEVQEAIRVVVTVEREVAVR